MRVVRGSWGPPESEACVQMPPSANRRASAVPGPPELPQTSALRMKPISYGAWHTGGASWTPWARFRGTTPDPIPCSPQCASRRLPHRQAGVEQQRPEASHGVPPSQARQRRPLLHQPGQPRAGALADLGARVLELRERTSVREQSARAGTRRQGRVALLGGSGGGLPPAPPRAARRALASLFLAAPPLARRPPLAQSRSPPPPRPDSRP